MCPEDPKKSESPTNDIVRLPRTASSSAIDAPDPTAFELFGHEYVETDLVLDATRFFDPTAITPLPIGWSIVEGDRAHRRLSVAVFDASTHA